MQKKLVNNLPSKEELISLIAKKPIHISQILSHFQLSHQYSKILKKKLYSLVKNKVLLQYKNGIYNINSSKHQHTNHYNLDHYINTNVKFMLKIDTKKNQVWGILNHDNKVKLPVKNPYNLMILNNEFYIGVLTYTDKQYVINLHSTSIGSDDIVYGKLLINDDNYLLLPISKNLKHTSVLDFAPDNRPKDLKNGMFIKAIIEPARSGYAKIVKFIEVIDPSQSHAHIANLYSIHEFNLISEFPSATLKEAQQAEMPSLENRTDLREYNFVTIDGADAKDFDDAIWARPLEDSQGGHHIMVAIADVSHFVKPNTSLDKEAFSRGNSVYLPGTVLPMLPEGLSNNLCSLMPNVDRAVFVADMKIDKYGNLLEYKFYKALIKSHARLTYSEVEDALFKNNVSENIKPLLKPAIKPIYNAYLTLLKNRQKRNTLDIQSHENSLIFDNSGNLVDIVAKPELTSHEIIEEFMILANVSAAKMIDDSNKMQYIYRVHDSPPMQKHVTFINFLRSINIKLPSKTKTLDHASFAYVKQKTRNTQYEDITNSMILQTQARAVYSNKNIGHFGLNLKDYTHFTSPIRRYSDLIVHRVLSEIINNQKRSLDAETANFICEHISFTERNAAMAEYKSIERIIAMWLQNTAKDRVFSGYIATINAAGLFVQLNEINFSGLVPMHTLGNALRRQGRGMSIRSKNSKNHYYLGAKIKVKILDANELKGLVSFIVVD